MAMNARFLAFALVWVRSLIFWHVMQYNLVVILRQLICPIIKGQEVQEDCLTLKDGTIRLSCNVSK